MNAGADLLLQPADALHEEFVGVRRGDGEEFDSFEERRAAVARFVQDTAIELEPREFAIEKELGRAEVVIAVRRNGDGAPGAAILAVLAASGSFALSGGDG